MATIKFNTKGARKVLASLVKKNKSTYSDHILMYLAEHKKGLSQMECYQQIGTTRLGGYIHHLRKYFTIHMESKEFTTWTGRKSSYGIYTLVATTENLEAWDTYWEERKNG